MVQCKNNSLKTWSELSAIMQKFIKNEQVKSKVAKNNADDADA